MHAAIYAVAVGVVGMAKWDALYLAPLWAKSLAAAACSVIMIFLAPVNNENRRLNAHEKKAYTIEYWMFFLYNETKKTQD